MRTLTLFLLIPIFGCGNAPPPLPVCANPPVAPCDRGCNDGKKDALDTDIDCGGQNPADGSSWCVPCAAGKACLTGKDCQSQMCVNQVCQPSTCSDRIKNGIESDIDCGGGEIAKNLDAGILDADICPPCEVGGTCRGALDCQSQICANSTCSPSLCNDGRKDAAETDTDCGGPVCSPCATGRACIKGTDCMSTLCVNNVCA